MSELDRNSRIVVLAGGDSAEREISLKSGSAITKAIESLGYTVKMIDPADQFLPQLEADKPNFVFIALHGLGGEDGTMQAVLEKMGIAYSGCGVLCAALAMNKLQTKRIWDSMSLPTPKFEVLSYREYSDDCGKDIAISALAKFGGQVFVKQVCEGSSYGLFKVTNEQEMDQALEHSKPSKQDLLIEQLIDGDEYTVAITEGLVLPSIKIVPARDFYDFEAKYKDAATEFLLPSGLDEQDEAAIQALALKAFDAIGGEVWGRVDILRDRTTGQFLLLEVNTIPGMTERSLVPRAAGAIGIGFADYVEHVMQASFKRFSLA